MEWRVETTEEWRKWWSSLPESFQDEVAAVVGPLRTTGTDLPAVPEAEHLYIRHLERLRKVGLIP